MKSKTKRKQSLWQHKLKFVVDENLEALKAEQLAPKKLAMANARLKKRRTLPK